MFTFVSQNLHDIQRAYTGSNNSFHHTTKSNNWLKLHHEPMRRKPFKRQCTILDEFNNIQCHNTITTKGDE